MKLLNTTVQFVEALSEADHRLFFTHVVDAKQQEMPITQFDVGPPPETKTTLPSKLQMPTRSGPKATSA